jgi:hypothetical protein
MCSLLNIPCQYAPRTSDEIFGRAPKHRVQKPYKQLKPHADILERVPDSKASTFFQTLESSYNTSRAFAMSHRSPCTGTRLSELETIRQTLPPTATRIEVELMMQHSAVYTILEPLEKGLIDFDKLVPDHAYRSSFEASAGSHNANPVLPSRRSRQKWPPRIIGPNQSRAYCDSRLYELDIRYWTTIAISNDMAACVLSNYFEYYHPIFACFDADFFISDLISHKLDFCSPFLLNALMAWACVSIRSLSE